MKYTLIFKMQDKVIVECYDEREVAEDRLFNVFAYKSTDSAKLINENNEILIECGPLRNILYYIFTDIQSFFNKIVDKISERFRK